MNIPEPNKSQNPIRLHVNADTYLHVSFKISGVHDKKILFQ